MNAQLPGITNDRPRSIMGMNGKRVLITGANSGVGFVAAKRLAASGAKIVMVCRDPDRGDAARAQIAEHATGPAPELLLADLSSQAEIRRLAQDVRARHDWIDVVLNNAGTAFSKRELGVDGIERTFATNHLAPFLLTNLLLDLVVTAPAGRVVTVATEVYAKKLDFANLQGERSYQFFRAYQASKLANILFAYELARRLEGTRATSTVVSPGPSRTGFGGGLTGAAGVLTGVMKRTPRFGTAEDGARVLVYAAMDPSLDGVSGRFFYKMRELKTKPITHDVELAARMWQVSEELCHLAPRRPDTSIAAGGGGRNA